MLCQSPSAFDVRFCGNRLGRRQNPERRPEILNSLSDRPQGYTTHAKYSALEVQLFETSGRMLQQDQDQGARDSGGVHRLPPPGCNQADMYVVQ